MLLPVVFEVAPLEEVAGPVELITGDFVVPHAPHTSVNARIVHIRERMFHLLHIPQASKEGAWGERAHAPTSSKD